MKLLRGTSLSYLLDKSVMPFLCCAILLFALFIPVNIYADNFNDDPLAYLMPYPKIVIRLSGYINISRDSLIIISDSANEKLVIGAREINEKIAAMQGYRLNVSVKNRSDASSSIIVIGNPERDTALTRYYQSCRLKTKDHALGDQGYIIEFIRFNGGNVICVWGNTPQGILYGCITLSQLICKQGIVKANIIDKPDFLYRMSQSLKTYYNVDKRKAKELIDFALRYKINIIWSGFNLDENDVSLKDPQWFHEINEYAWKRGIRIVYAWNWSVGHAPVPPSTNKLYYPYGNLIGHDGMTFSWDDDEKIISKGKKIQDFIRLTQPKALFFHPIDTGGIRNPELWDYRSAGARKRFGNDRAAADANVINLLYGAVKNADKEIAFMTVVYPYWPSFLKHKKTSLWLGRLSSLIPSDVILCMRESTRDDFLRWKKYIVQPSLIYHESETADWALRRPFTTSFRYAKTFYEPGGTDMYWHTGGGGPWSIVKTICAAEYSWNVNAQGSAYLQDSDEIPYWQQATTDNQWINNELLLRVSKNIFTDSPKIVADIIRLNLSPYVAANPQKWTDKSFFEKYLSDSLKALQLIADYEKNNPKYNQYYFVVKAHTIACRYLTEARLKIIRAQSLVNAGFPHDASLEINDAYALINQGEAYLNQYTIRDTFLDYNELKKKMTADIKSNIVLNRIYQ